MTPKRKKAAQKRVKTPLQMLQEADSTAPATAQCKVSVVADSTAAQRKASVGTGRRKTRSTMRQQAEPGRNVGAAHRQNRKIITAVQDGEFATRHA